MLLKKLNLFMRKTYFLFLFITIISCGKNNNNEMISADLALVDNVSAKSETSDKLLPPLNPIEEKTAPDNAQKISQKIIKTGSMEIEVGNISKAQQIINGHLKKLDAYKQGESFNNSDNKETLRMTIRVPNQNFDNLLQSFSSELGNVVSKNVGIDDVTEEYTDV